MHRFIFCLLVTLLSFVGFGGDPAALNSANPSTPLVQRRFPTNLPNFRPAPELAGAAQSGRPGVMVPISKTNLMHGLSNGPRPEPAAETVLTWDHVIKETTAKTGDTEARFSFNVTNLSKAEVVIDSVQTSCGCTVAELPSTPWKLAVGDHGSINVSVDLAGKSGVITKNVTVNSDKGIRILTVQVTIPDPTSSLSTMDREQNQKLAVADRQRVFKGDCARCHVAPTVGKSGGELFSAACGICHESEHRATMVPNLHALNHATDREFWKTWTQHGKLNSLMPAFSKAEGGPLSDQQIDSLADYLTSAIPSKPGAPPAPSPTSVSK